MQCLPTEELCLNLIETFSQTKAKKGRESLGQESKKQCSSNDTTGFQREKSSHENEFVRKNSETMYFLMFKNIFTLASRTVISKSLPSC